MTMTSFIASFEGCVMRNKSASKQTKTMSRSLVTWGKMIIFRSFVFLINDMNSRKSHNAPLYNYGNFTNVSEKRFGHCFVLFLFLFLLLFLFWSIRRIVFRRMCVQDMVLQVQCVRAKYFKRTWLTVTINLISDHWLRSKSFD